MTWQRYNYFPKEKRFFIEMLFPQGVLDSFPGRLVFSLCVVMWLLHYTRTSNVFLRGSVSPPLLLTRIPPFTFSNSVIVKARALIKFCVIILKFLLLYIYCSESQRKDTAVFGDSQTFRRLLTEVMATGAAICDKAATRRLNRVAKAVKFMIEGIKKRTPLNPIIRFLL